MEQIGKRRMGSTNTPTPQTLDYAPPVPWYRRATLRRRVMLTAVALLVLGAGLWTPRLIRHVRILYWQGKCMNHTAGPDQVVYDGVATTAASRAGDRQFVVARSGGVLYAMRTNEAWSTLESLVSAPGGKPAALAFMRAMKTPKGERLFVIEMSNKAGRPAVHCTTVKPGGLLSSPIITGGVTIYEPAPPAEPIRIFAGQIDPSDATHFTIRWESTTGERGTFHGWFTGQDVRFWNREDRQPPLPATGKAAQTP